MDDPRGLFLYDNLAKRELLEGSRTVQFAKEFGDHNPCKINGKAALFILIVGCRIPGWWF